MQNILFQDLNGVLKGESTSAQLQGNPPIELHSFSHGIHMPLMQGARSNTGRTHGRVVHGDIQISKYWDLSSPTWLQNCSLGIVHPKFMISVFQADAVPIKYLQIDLEDCIIASMSLSMGGGDLPVESISINYTKIQWTYIKQAKEGGQDGNNHGSWNLETNAVAW